MTGGKVSASVVIPCWNVDRWVGRCLDEVFAALPDDAEAIAVDDGSTDGTLAMLESRAAAEPRLKVIARPHAGVSAARNAALDAVKGEILFFVDPDDGVEPDFFRAMLGEMERTGADCCVTAFRRRRDGTDGFADERLKADYRFGTNAEIREGYLSRIFGFTFGDVERWYAGEHIFARREMASACRMAYRRALVEELKLRFDESVELYEDSIFNAGFLLAARSMACVDRPLYRVTERPSGAMSSVPRDPVRLCRNKLALLAARMRLDAASGGALARYCEGSLALGALEMLSASVRRLPRLDCFAMLRGYLREKPVKSALRGFPVSLRKPLVLLAVRLLRLFA